MRKITDHIKNPVNDKIEIEVLDAPGAGGANHQYRIVGPTAGFPRLHIVFQNGAINEVGVNGVTNEALLAVVIDRLSSFQKGPFACPENATALTHCLAAMGQMHERTADRMKRGVEGKAEK